MSNPLKDLSNFGQSPWMDFISRPMLESGELARMLGEDGVKGVTSNPSIFDKAISSGSDYDAGIRAALDAGVREPEAVFERLAVRDIREACDILKPVYDETDGVDGYVSLEVSPTLAYDTEGTAAAAERLFAEVDRPNVMIKIPATKEGLPAIAASIGKGINVNVTLIFSLERYMEVMNAYLDGLEKLAGTGTPLKKAASVASFFISRIDSAVDAKLPEDSPLRGKIAVANAKIAYKLFQKVFSSKRWKALESKGARVQRPLWASTSTKDPSLPDTLYVDALIGRDTVNTIPPATWDAFRDHGTAAETITQGVDEAKGRLETLTAAGIDLGAVTRELEEKGVKSFADAFAGLMHHLKDKVESMGSRDPGNPSGETAPAPDAEGLVSRIWSKDPAVWKEDASHQAIIRNSLGWLGVADEMSGRVAELEAFSREVREAGFEAVVVLGMGGSSLAPEVLRRSFAPKTGHPVLRVLDSTEPETVEAVLGASSPERTLFIVASKSGSTTEPMRFFDYAWSKIPNGTNFVAITDPGSQLEALASERGFRRCFLNFADIGGRFSALSYFGLVPAAAAGIDCGMLLVTAKAMASACRDEGDGNPGLALGSWLAQRHAEGRDKIIFLADEGVASLSLWLEQLVAESTGKEGKGVVPVAGEPRVETAYYGDDRAFVRIRLGENRDDAQVLQSLKGNGHPVYEIDMSSPMALGAEFFRWEFATAVLGAKMGIDPFDQPDVQSAKDKTKALLTQLRETGSLPVPDAEIAFSPAAGVASLEAFWGLAKRGDYASLLAFLPSDQIGTLEEPFARLRKSLILRLRTACQFGYGPRYLHSTGQLHKGGADNGLFVVFMRDDGPEVPIDGANLSFKQLVRAQAIGDFEALCDAGRRAALIRVSGDLPAAIAKVEASLAGVPAAAV